MQQLQQSEQFGALSYFLLTRSSIQGGGAILFIHLVFPLLTVDNLELNIHDTYLYEMSLYRLVKKNGF